MKDSTISTILFTVGIIIIIVSHTYMLIRESQNIQPSNIVLHIIVTFAAVVLLIASWIVEMKARKGEKFTDYSNEYNYALQSGRPVAGTVYADCPGCGPGLGWIL